MQSVLWWQMPNTPQIQKLPCNNESQTQKEPLTIMCKRNEATKRTTIKQQEKEGEEASTNGINK